MSNRSLKAARRDELMRVFEYVFGARSKFTEDGEIEVQGSNGSIVTLAFDEDGVLDDVRGVSSWADVDVP